MPHLNTSLCESSLLRAAVACLVAVLAGGCDASSVDSSSPSAHAPTADQPATRGTDDGSVATPGGVGNRAPAVERPDEVPGVDLPPRPQPGDSVNEPTTPTPPTGTEADDDTSETPAGPTLAPAGCEPPADLADEPLLMLATDRPYGVVAHYYDLVVSDDGDTVFAAGVPGVVAYDVADGALERIGQYPLTSMPTDGFDAAALVDDGLLALVNGEMNVPLFMGGDHFPSRLSLMDVSEPAAPQYVSTLTLGGAADVAALGDQVFITDPNGQLVVVDVANPAQPVIIATLPTFNTPRGIVLHGHYAYVADMVMGLLVVDISVASSPEVVAIVDTAGGAQRLSLDDDVLWVSCGASGFEAFDVSDPASPQLLGGASTGKPTAGLRARGDVLWTTEHETITTWDVSDPSQPRRLRTASTPGYALDVLPLAGGEAIVADWEEVERWRFDGAETHPQVDVPVELFFAPGEPVTTLPIQNTGAGPLTITGLEAGVPGYEIHLAETQVAPGHTVEATVVWTGPGPAPHTAVCLATDDPGAALTSIEVEMPAADVKMGPKVGDPAPDFVLSDLDGNLHALSDYAGKPVLVVLFANWCPICHYELPDIEASIWAEYKDEGLQVLAIGGYQETIGAVAEFKKKYNLTFPVLYDDAGTVLEAYRFVYPGASGETPFPQDFLIGSDGRLLWRGDTYAPQAITKLVETQL